ncbi:TIGR03503 family protein [Paraneptunicella aestuarii]|uniref:TIGR03503 family protein n=1 Tax=Paraneptunicella aestuarii TaxID=2831148 RepID=UPI001E4C6AFA|nr:TIGR03503 family protein [Paraneptunicella aestuarii]UAA37231.1 TIGR03503 family protein [Paraneptunicella aestuarii]
MSRVIYLFAILLTLGAFAQESDQEYNANKQKTAVEQVDTTPLREIGSEYHNGIRLLQNRFRIDYKVDEITMVFFRKFGSAPIVLVRPDGSKIFLSQAEENDVEWYDSTTYDMIRMKNPTPGPWQAVGQILPGSRVMVLSDIELQAEPLPTVLFSGEILKQTAYLTNGGKPIDYAEFRDVVKLNMEFVSTNNPNFNNFGAQTQTIATFEDNGKGMDERPLDGTFTGQFNLTIPAGEWKPIFTVSTPMFTREQVSEPIILHENPIKVDVKLDDTGSGYHKLMVDADREMVDMGSLLVDGKIRYPNGDVQNFSITRVSNDVRTYDVVNFEYGIFRVKLTAYGNTIDGRDFILDVPEFTFFAEEPELPAGAPPKQIESIPEDALSAEALALQEMKRINQPVVEDDSMSTSTLVKLIIGINLGIIIIGAGVIWFIVSRKKTGSSSKKPNNKTANKTLSMPKMDFSGMLNSMKGLMSKLPKAKPGKSGKKKEKA